MQQGRCDRGGQEGGREGRLSGERTLRVPPFCSLSVVSHAGGPHVASFVVGRPCVRGACVRAGVARRAANAAGALPRFTRQQFKEVGGRASGSLRATHRHRSYAVESAMACSVHFPSAWGARFTGRTGPLSWAMGGWLYLKRELRRRGKLVTTDGELRRPTSSRFTDGDTPTS